jgi:hypothetical protein
MQSGNAAKRPSILAILAVLFLTAYFFLFAGNGLGAYFTFDDGLNLVHLHRVFEVPFRTNVLDTLRVFTPAYRPLGALFYRPLYALAGFNPLPFRIAAYALMILNIVLAYRFSRALGATPEAATLAVLLFSYNGSMVDLYYNTGTIYDLLCFPFYIGAVIVYVRDRSAGKLRFGTMLAVLLMFLAALDAKEMAVTLPAMLLVYEALYRTRDYRSLAAALRPCGFLVVMFAAAAWFAKVKVTEMSGNGLYRPHHSTGFMLGGIGHYFEQLFYLEPKSFSPAHVLIAVAVLLAAALALRSRAVAYSAIFFVIGLLPLSVIDPRSGYAAYIAYPGITLAIAIILDSAKSALIRISGKLKLRTAGTVVLFLAVATVSIKSFAHTRKILMTNALWDQERRVELIDGLRRAVPDFPRGAKILFLDDPWASDWGPMFLTDLLYDNPVWVDRVRNGWPVEDRANYDLLVTYDQPLQATRSPRMLGVRKTWDTLWYPIRAGHVTVAPPAEDRGPRNVEYSPSSRLLTVQGLADVKIDAVYRVGTDVHYADGFCTLDAKGSCTAPADGMLNIDWVRPSSGRWIFTGYGTTR